MVFDHTLAWGIPLASLILIFMLIRFRTMRSTDESITLRYRSRGALMSRPELDAYQWLTRTFPRHIICPKVRLADLLRVDPAAFSQANDRTAAFSAISQKHVDFVIADQTGLPLAVVEVDDSSHNRSDRRQRDVFVNEAFFEANILMVRTKPFRLSTNRVLQNLAKQLSGESHA